MSNESHSNSKHFLVAVTLIAAAAIYRIIPHPANVAPITAIALFGGAYISRKYLVFLIPFVALFISDMVLNNTILRSFYPDVEGIVWWSSYMTGTFLAFGLIILFGLFLLKKVSTLRVISVSLLSSFSFFLITNFFTWYGGTMYPMNFGGLIACITAGIPFFRPTILGDLLFTGVLFGAMEFMRTRSFLASPSSLRA